MGGRRWPVRALPYPQLWPRVGGGMFILRTLLLLAGLIPARANLTPCRLFPSDQHRSLSPARTRFSGIRCTVGGIAWRSDGRIFVTARRSATPPLFTFSMWKSRREERWLAGEVSPATPGISAASAAHPFSVLSLDSVTTVQRFSRGRISYSCVLGRCSFGAGQDARSLTRREFWSRIRIESLEVSSCMQADYYGRHTVYRGL